MNRGLLGLSNYRKTNDSFRSNRTYNLCSTATVQKVTAPSQEPQRKRQDFWHTGLAFGTKLTCSYGFSAVRSSLGQSSWGHRLSGDSLAVSAKSGARCIPLRLSWCLSLDMWAAQAWPRSRWLGREGRLQVQQQSEAVSHLKPGLLCPGEGWSRSHPVHSSESSAEWGNRRPHHWQGKKPSQITQTTKSHRRVSHCQKFQLWHYFELPRTDRHMWAGQTELLVLASERAKARFAIQFAMYNNTALYTSLTRCCLLQSSIN